MNYSLGCSLGLKIYLLFNWNVSIPLALKLLGGTGPKKMMEDNSTYFRQLFRGQESILLLFFSSINKAPNRWEPNYEVMHMQKKKWLWYKEVHISFLTNDWKLKKNWVGIRLHSNT